jgi:hypothetical protein
MAASLTAGQLATNGQVQNPSMDDKTARAEVKAIVKRLLQESERDLGQGVKAFWAPLASAEDLAKVSALGDHAMPALEELLVSEDARTCTLAIRLMGARGSDKYAPALVSFLRLNRANASCRATAVLWLRDAPEAIVGQALHDLAEKDTDPSVQRAAKSALGSRRASAK